MKINPEQWFDENRHAMPAEIIDGFEALRMFLRGWPLYEKINGPLATEMIAHACSKVDNPGEIPMLQEALTMCARFYIMTLCGEMEATLRNNEMDYSADYIDKDIAARNKKFDEALKQESWAGSKSLLEETIAIFQNAFLPARPELMDIDSKWWQFYKFTFQLNSMRWQIDAYQIVLDLRKGKQLNDLTEFTHQKELDAVKTLVEAIEEVEGERNR